MPVNTKVNLSVILLIAIVFAVHFSFIPNGFTWLDHNDLEQKRAILPLAQLYKAFATPFGETSFYRPLVTVSYSLDNAIYGNQAAGYHLTNVLLHLGVTILAPYFIAIFFNLNSWQKLWSTLIVGLHPASILAVGSLTQRQEMLVAIFLILALYFYKRARQSQWVLDSILTLTATLAAFLAKETALVLVPLFIFLIEVWRVYAGNNKYRLWISLTIATGIYVIIRLLVVPKIWGQGWEALSFSQHIGTRLGLIAKWGLLLVSPFKPNFSDAVPVLDLTAATTWVALFTLLVVSIIIWRAGIQSDLGKALIITLILLAPGLNIIPVPRIGSPHYAYLPVLGMALLVVVILNKYKKSALILSLLLVLWLTISAVTVNRAGFQFKNDETLFTPEVQKDKNFIEGYYYLGNYFLAKRDITKAATAFESSLKKTVGILAFRNDLASQINLAGVWLEQGRLLEADELYLQLFSKVPYDTQPYIIFNRALIAYRQGNYNSVVEYLTLDSRTLTKAQPLLLLIDSMKNLGKENEAKQMLAEWLPKLSAGDQHAVLNQTSL